MSEEFVYGVDPRPVPEIASVTAEPGHVLNIEWVGGGSIRVDLSGWIGFHKIADLQDEAVFSRPEIGEEADTVQWNGDEDLSIDSVHLEMLAEQQAEFTSADLSVWQDRFGLSNREAADLLGVAPSTWSLYKAGGTIPGAVRIACRAVEKDALLFEAHFRPSRRPSGRPPKAA